MEISEKLAILADAAKYDVSCSSSGSDRKAGSGGFGKSVMAGVCHTWSADGRCVSLLKVLLSNVCIYDCQYCRNRVSNDIPRASFTPEELAGLVISFYKRNYIEGLFLSSGVIRNADYTMELLIRALKLLRYEHGYGGYIHVKLIAGASERLVREITPLADRVSSNIELPSSESLSRLAPEKKRDDIINSFRDVRSYTLEKNEDARSMMSSQIIVGASPETDSHIIKLAESLYDKKYLTRFFYSAYIPVNSGRMLPALKAPPLVREHRLYQADWLIRFYGYRQAEIFGQRDQLDLYLDPKTVWALDSLDIFPVDVNYADRELLLRIPGIGQRGVQKILQARKHTYLRAEHLKRMNISLKRARFFIKFNHGSIMEKIAYQREDIESALKAELSDKHMGPSITVPELIAAAVGEV